MPPRAVVFDIGNVLIRWDPEGFYDGRIGPERRQELFAQVPLYEMNERIDRGADFEGEVEGLAARFPDYAVEIRHWFVDWAQFVEGEIALSVALLRNLRAQGVPVFALSNFGAAPFDLAAQTYPFLLEFDRAFLSGPLGMAKPDTEIYAHLEAETGLPPEALFFTDDKPENLVPAAARGWTTHRFTAPELLRDDLVSQGLLRPGVTG